jgi:hypothetical protein
VRALVRMARRYHSRNLLLQNHMRHFAYYLTPILPSLVCGGLKKPHELPIVPTRLPCVAGFPLPMGKRLPKDSPRLCLTSPDMIQRSLDSSLS